MSIVVKNVVKKYGNQLAVNDVSFEIGKGEVVGFIGPNGAGKSTLMKIMCTYISATSGSASINGYDVQQQSMDVRRSIGYLPEHNPLYHDMYVKEYLGFVAGIYRLGKATEQRVKQMIEATGLGSEQHKKIGSLSKGYRQRVGLAQAMIHDPAVLILDEPTTGLDPNQIIEIRTLIAETGKAKTVLLSTHILQEVEAICTRTIIINKGVIVANSSVQYIQQQGQTISVEFNAPIDKSLLLNIPGVEKVLPVGKNQWLVYGQTEMDIRAAIFQLAVSQNIAVLGMQQHTKNLEDIFHELTQ